MPEPVVIVDYDPAWPHAFARRRDRVREALGGLAQAVEHVGSTAVPGLAAKPIIDMDVVVAESAVAAAIAALERAGYRHQGDQGIPGREAFQAPPGFPPHHLYLCAPGARELRRHLFFRDHLRAHPEAVRRYAKLKQDLAGRLGGDREAYTAGKTAFVEAILALMPPES